MEKKKRQVGRPSEKNSLETDSILRAALQSFAQHGYGGVTISGLAKKSGVADSLFHYHFGTKEELWKKSMLLTGGEILHSLEDIFALLDHISGIEKLRIYIKKIVLVSANYPEFQQVVVQEVFSDSPRSNWLIEELLKPIFKIMEDVIKFEQESGNIKPVPKAHLSSFIIGSIVTFFARSHQMKKLYGVNSFDETEIQNHITYITDLIFNGLLGDTSAN